MEKYIVDKITFCIIFPKNAVTNVIIEWIYDVKEVDTNVRNDIVKAVQSRKKLPFSINETINIMTNTIVDSFGFLLFKIITI